MRTATHTVIPHRCSLYQQAHSSRWYARIKLENGQWYRASTAETELEAAKLKALKLYYESAVKAQHNLPQSTRSFKSVARAMSHQLEQLKGTLEWKQTYQSYIYAITRYQIPFFGNTKLDNIHGKYAEYVRYVTEQIGRAPKKSTLSNHHAALKLVLIKAAERGWCQNTVLPTIKHAGADSSRRPTFELSEYRSLIQKLRHWSQQKSHRHKDTEIRQMLYDYVLILANSGIRHGREAMDIKWKNISFAKSTKRNDIVTINVTKRKGRAGTEQARTVVVRHNDVSDVKRVLERIRQRNSELAALTLEQVIAQRLDIKLFCLSDGTQPKRMDGTFKKFLQDAKLLVGAEDKARTLYSFRHFYATQQLLAEPPITVYLLAKQMGTSVKMIEHHYGHYEAYQKADSLSGWRQLD